MNVKDLDTWLGTLPGRPTLRRVLVPSPAVEQLQLGHPHRDVGRMLKSVRWGLYAAAAILIFGACMEFGPPKETYLTQSGEIAERNYPDAGFGWLFSGISLLVAATLAAIVCVWLARHVAHPAYFPNCPTCGREEETKWAKVEARILCRRCNRKVPLNEIRPAWRRSFRSL